MFFSKRVPPKAREAYNRDALSGMLVAVMLGLTTPFVAVIARDRLHATDVEIGILSMSGVAGNLLSLLWARMMEGRRKMPFAVVTLAVARAMFFLVLFAYTHTVFVALIAAINIIASVSGPAYSAVMKEIYPDGDRARIMGYTRSLMWCVCIIVTAISSWLLSVISYRYAFPVAAVFGVASILVFGRIPTSDTSGDPSVGHLKFFLDSLRILIDDPGYRWFCLGIFLFGFANFLAQPIYVIYQVDKLGVRTQWAGVYSVVSQICMIGAFYFWGWHTDRRRPEILVAVQALVWSLIPFSYYFATQPWMLLPAVVIGGVMGAGIELSYFNGVLYFAPPERITQYQALFAMLMGFRGILAPYIGTLLLANHVMSMKAIFVSTGCLIVISVVVQLVGMRRHDSLREAVSMQSAGGT